VRVAVAKGSGLDLCGGGQEVVDAAVAGALRGIGIAALAVRPPARPPSRVAAAPIAAAAPDRRWATA
jgi:hypothetical protein